MDLKPHILCRVIKDVEQSLPLKIECIMSPLQKQSKFGVQDIRELLTDFKLITLGSSILDLGYAPGAWLHVSFIHSSPSISLTFHFTNKVLLVLGSLPESRASKKWRLCFGY
ncbi:protein CHROMATIN REMODELING 5 isoform X2 [Cucumis melo var. makuwa]|uniref:Protein CHROMATIN REMODELING 5 isoform X2 n=1 Tax=Cucumis melo var. makuwa TaxID=1194695 RepID=A0A5A7T2D4_CUCMM|nr:protein CHROMATIN REMODELING 5 isoform X2 [Cucumis melo var. makuwa]TYK22769.1 protein CHROMATIN REMODELING 5 isoform X2 [Cucumis melo var. makuwa]